MEDRLFGLDIQLLFDALVIFVFLMALYLILSRLFFNPVRAYLEKRKAAVDADKAEAARLQEEAAVSKAAYEEILKAVHKEAEEIISASRKTALADQAAIIDHARSEASAIMEQADREIAADKQQLRDSVRKEILVIADAMTAQFAGSAPALTGEALLDETLAEMDGETWLRQ